MCTFTSFVAGFVLAATLWGSEAQQPLLVQQVTTAVVHGEGPHWDDRHQLLYFVDIESKLVNRYDPETKVVSSVKFEGGDVSLVIPVTATDDQFVVSHGRDIVLLTWDGSDGANADFKIITSVESDKPGNRFNDGKTDRSGRLWAGTMGPEEIVGEVTPNQGSFYSLNPNSNEPVNQLSPVSVSNGLAWTSDNSIMYYIDTPTLRVDAFDFNIEQGTISNRRPVFDLAANNITGFPDGMTIDSDGNLWVAVFNGGKVLHVDPQEGKLLQTVTIPVTRVTSVTFGDSDLRTLYVTTSRFGLSEEELEQQPLAGCLFTVTGLGVRGTHDNTAIRTVH